MLSFHQLLLSGSGQKRSAGSLQPDATALTCCQVGEAGQGCCRFCSWRSTTSAAR